jgi:hypothetical protein
MTEEIITIDDRELKALARLFQRSPKRAKLAVAFMLNDMAFQDKDNSFDVINETNDVRDKRFVKSSLQVERARFARSIDQMYSKQGSVKRPRFSGWLEQQTGGKDPRGHTMALKSRTGGTKRGKVRGRERYKKQNKFLKQGGRGFRPIHGSSGADQDVAAMLSVVRRKGIRNKHIMIHSSNYLVDDVYMLKTKKKIRTVGSIRGSDKNIERTNWKNRSTKRTMSERTRYARLWRRHMIRAMQHEYKKRKRTR